MARTTIIIGVALILLGLFSYLVLPSMLGLQASPTALIPAAFGLPLLILGFLARDDAKRKTAMHIAAALGLIGFVASAAMGVPKLLTMLSGGTVNRPAAVVVQCIMALFLGVFTALCVRSFIEARRQRAGS